MPISHRIDRDLGVVYLYVTGRVQPVDQSRHLKSLLADPDFRAGLHYLVDWRDGDESNTSEEVRMMADAVRRESDRLAESRFAIVVRSDVQYGLTRVFAAFVGDAPLEFRTFRKIDDACRWLGESVGRPVSPP
jgi:hypothetical protein